MLVERPELGRHMEVVRLDAPRDEELPAIAQVWLEQLPGDGAARVPAELVEEAVALARHHLAALGKAELCFYLSYGRIVPPEQLGRFAHNLVVHESDLPAGKGWSPLSWQVLAARNEIAVTLFEAAAKVDSGPIYGQARMTLDGTELVERLRDQQSRVTFQLCQDFIDRYPASLTQARPQSGADSFYPRRKPADSRLDPAGSIQEQFPLLRIVDNARYPAFFERNGRRYRIEIHEA